MGGARLHSSLPQERSKVEVLTGNIGQTVKKPVTVDVSEKHQSTSATVATRSNDGNESEGSVEIVERSNRVINVDDSDVEQPGVTEPPRESSSTGTQTLPQNKET